MKRIAAILLLLTLTFSFAACKKDAAYGKETELQNALKDYSQVIEPELPDDLRLKVYYLDTSILTRAPLTVDNLIHFSGVNEIVIDCEHLKEHTDLLRQINTDRLTPVAEPSNLHARLCYIFETDSAGELLVVAFGGENSSVFVNGVEVAFDDIFRDVIKPFVSEDVMNDLEYIYNGKIKLNDTPEESTETQSNLQANDLPQIETSTISEEYYWEDIDTAIHRDCVMNAETAVSISDCILSQYQAEGYYVGYVPQLVEFQDDPGIWVVSYWENETIPQATFSIAIRKDTAEVLRMWIGE